MTRSRSSDSFGCMSSGLSSFFGHSERSKGAELLRKGLVVISSSTDTNVSAFVKGSSACRVTLLTDDVASPALSSSCTCSQARSGKLCKHIWSVLLKLEENGADLIDGKSEIHAPGVRNSPADEARSMKAEEFKTQQRQKLKERYKEIRQQKKRAERGPQIIYPDVVQEALDYFSNNGFPLSDLDMANLINARKLLSRVFHPDKGGSHEEILELNVHFENLESYLKNSGTR